MGFDDCVVVQAGRPSAAPASAAVLMKSRRVVFLGVETGEGKEFVFMTPDYHRAGPESKTKIHRETKDNWGDILISKAWIPRDG